MKIYIMVQHTNSKTLHILRMAICKLDLPHRYSTRAKDLCLIYNFMLFHIISDPRRNQMVYCFGTV